MRCYNMFPRQFSNINEMRAYLKKVHDMGFDGVWVNPIQQSGKVLLTCVSLRFTEKHISDTQAAAPSRLRPGHNVHKLHLYK